MKKVISVVLVAVMLITMAPCAFATGGRSVSYEETLAADLKELGLFKGVSETNFNLGRAPSRIEALVMLIRVLGKEQEALNGTWEHPFTDVPKWADQYVGYAYENKLANGVSKTEYGTGNADARTYLTFVLRALGYSDTNGEDFTWSSPYALSSEVGILVDRVDLEDFWRADVVLISYAALAVPLKGSDQTLAEKLIAAGAFTQAQFDASFNPDFLNDIPKDSEKEEPTKDTPADSNTTSNGEKLSAQEISEKCSDAVFYITCYGFNGAVKGSGSGFFISSDGLAITNFHVVANCSAVDITLTDGTVYKDVDVVDGYSAGDLALLRVNGSGFPYLELGDSSALKQGQQVYAIGSPLGLDNTMSAGIVSNVKRVIDGKEYIQISVPIAPGSSGGALLNEYGKVVGVTTAGYASSTGDLNLAIGSNFIAKLDQSETERYVFWDRVYYPLCKQTYDFGVFSGADLLGFEMTFKGWMYVYDALDFHDSPYQGARSHFDSCLFYYGKALELNGFEQDPNDPHSYSAENERIIFSVNEEGTAIYIFLERKVQYYTECPALPDLAWYMDVDPVPMDKIENSWTWMYDWANYYHKDDFQIIIETYFDLLVEEGFTLVYEEAGSKVFEGKGLSVLIMYNGNTVYLDVCPLNQ